MPVPGRPRPLRGTACTTGTSACMPTARASWRQFKSLSPAPSELAESLEQLRAIHHGYAIHVEAARERPGPGVDTPADLERVRAIFAREARSG